jgi:hypothetical protein
VQILTLDAGGRQLRIMGSAGFGHWPDFFDWLMECRERGAALRMIDSFRDQAPVLVPGRWAVIRDDPAWAPLRDYLGERAWESFASIQMMACGLAVDWRSSSTGDPARAIAASRLSMRSAPSRCQPAP